MGWREGRSGCLARTDCDENLLPTLAAPAILLGVSKPAVTVPSSSLTVKPPPAAHGRLSMRRPLDGPARLTFRLPRVHHRSSRKTRN